MTCAHPQRADALSKFAEPPSEKNQLVLEHLKDAQQITGTCAFVTGKVRASAHFAFIGIAGHVNEAKFTKVVWHEVLRLGHFLVATKHRALVFRPIGAGAYVEAYADSSNAPPGDMRRSPGGYLLRLTNGVINSAPFAWKSTWPRKPHHASSGGELEQFLRCTKAALGVQIFFREAHFGYLVKSPTPVHTDANVVLDGTHCRRVSSQSKCIATNYAMVRQAELDGAIIAVKCASEDNPADILTKPLTGASFARAEDLIMGRV